MRVINRGLVTQGARHGLFPGSRGPVGPNGAQLTLATEIPGRLPGPVRRASPTRAHRTANRRTSCSITAPRLPHAAETAVAMNAAFEHSSRVVEPRCVPPPDTAALNTETHDIT